ncbi:hypothetical protein E8E11_004548 [Didymella keratinophila]|nr:hypothetical protein E8E11_004548 [Didymella keratinophila]
MPPKRNAGAQSVPPASKKAKTPPPTSTATLPDAVDADWVARESTGQGDPSNAAQSADVPPEDMVEMNWALRTQADNKTRDESNADRELWVLVRAAVAGLLDWKTLLAWLYCNKLVIEWKLAKVDASCNFVTTTFYQDCDETGLQARVDEIAGDELTLLSVSEEEVPYVLENNMDFASISKRMTAVAGNIAASGKEDDDSSSEESGSGEDNSSENEDLNEESQKEALLDTMGIAKSDDNRIVLRRCSLGHIKGCRDTASQAACTELINEFQLELALEETAAGASQQSQGVNDNDEVVVEDVDGEVDEPMIGINKNSDEARKSGNRTKSVKQRKCWRGATMMPASTLHGKSAGSITRGALRS